MSMPFLASSTIGSACFSSLKYLSTVMPLGVMANTVLLLPTILSSIRFCLVRKSKYSFRTLQLTFALYIICVSFNGPRRDSTWRMSTYISSLERLIILPFAYVPFNSWNKEYKPFMNQKPWSTSTYCRANKSSRSIFATCFCSYRTPGQPELGIVIANVYLKTVFQHACRLNSLR